MSGALKIFRKEKDQEKNADSFSSHERETQRETSKACERAFERASERASERERERESNIIKREITDALPHVSAPNNMSKDTDKLKALPPNVHIEKGETERETEPFVAVETLESVRSVTAVDSQGGKGERINVDGGDTENNDVEFYDDEKGEGPADSDEESAQADSGDDANSKGEEEQEDSGSESDGSSDPFEADIIQAQARWVYFEVASDKLFEFIDNIAQLYVFNDNGGGIGLRNISIRQAWNRCIKVQSAVKSRDIKAAISAINVLQEQLVDRTLDTTEREPELQEKVDALLVGAAKILRGMKKFDIQLREMPPDSRLRVCEPAPESELEEDETDEKKKTGNGKPQQNSLIPTKFNKEQAKQALDELKQRAQLEIQVLKRNLLRNAKKYGLGFFLGKLKPADYVVADNDQIASMNFDSITKLDLNAIYAEADPPPRPCAYPLPIRPPPKLQHSAQFHHSAHIEKAAQDLDQRLEEDRLLEQSRDSVGGKPAFLEDEKALNAENMFNLGVWYEARGDYALAAQAFESVISASDGHEARPQAQYRLGRCYHNELKIGVKDNIALESDRRNFGLGKAKNAYMAVVDTGHELDSRAELEYRVRALLGQANIEKALGEPSKQVATSTRRAIDMLSSKRAAFPDITGELTAMQTSLNPSSTPLPSIATTQNATEALILPPI